MTKPKNNPQVARRREQVARWLVQGMTQVEIHRALLAVSAEAEKRGKQEEAKAFRITDRQLRRDIKLLREDQGMMVQTLTVDQVAAWVLTGFEAEHRELWTLYRGTTDPKMAGVRLGVLKSLQTLREHLIESLQVLGVLPETPFREELVSWVMSMDEQELTEFVHMGQEGIVEKMRARMKQPLRLVSGG